MDVDALNKKYGIAGEAEESTMDIDALNQKYNITSKEPQGVADPEYFDVEALKEKYGVEQSVFTHAEDVAQSIPKGLAKALKGTTQTAFGEDTPTPLSDWVLQHTGELETATGDISEGLVKFLSFYLGPGKVFAPFKTTTAATSITQASIRGGITDAFVNSIEDQRLSHTLKGMEWDNALISYLSSPSETMYEDKFKHFVEGTILGAGFDTALIGTKKLLDGYRALKDAIRNSGKTDEEIASELRSLADAGVISHEKIVSAVEKITQGELKIEDVVKAEADEVPIDQLTEGLKAEVEGVKPPVTSINYERTKFSDLEEEETQKIIEASANSSTVQSNEITIKGAKKILKENDAETILNKQVENVKELAEYDVAVRSLLVQAGDSLGVIWKGIDNIDDKISILVDNPEVFITLRQTADVVQESGTKIARALQSRNIKLDPKIVKEKLSIIMPSLDKAKKGIDLTDVEKEEVAKAIEELMQHTKVATAGLYSNLDKLDPKDGIFRKFINVITEIKLAGQLSSYTTQLAAMTGTFLKRTSANMEARYAWALGKIFNDKDRYHWNEVNALNSTEYSRAFETLGLMKRMLKSAADDDLAFEETLQRTALDGYISRFDEKLTEGAITKDYLAPNLNTNSMAGDFFGRTIDTVGAVNRMPFTLLSLQDDAAKRMFYMPHIKYLATKAANKLGLTGAALKKYVKEAGDAFDIYYMKRGNREFQIMQAVSKATKEGREAGLEGPELDDFIIAAKEKADKGVAFTAEEQRLIDKYVKPNLGSKGNPEMGIEPKMGWHDEAIERAREHVFQQELGGNSLPNKVIKWIAEGREIHPTVKWLLPYYKTVVNMTAEVAQRTPGLHRFSEQMKADLAAGGRRKRMAQAKLIQGTSMYALGGWLVSEGYITPTSDMNNFQEMRDAGVAEASLQLPWMDKPIALNRIEPLGTYLLMMAELNKATDYAERLNIQNSQEFLDKMDEIGGAYSLAFADVFVNKTMMDSIDQFQRALRNPDSPYWGNLAVSATVPGSALIRSLTDEQGETLRQARTIAESYQKILGEELAEQLGVSSGEPLPPELNLLGKPAQKRERYFTTTTKLVSENKVLQELYKIQAGVRKIDRDFSVIGLPIELGTQDHYKLQRILHEDINLEGQLANLFLSDRYKNARIGFDSSSQGTKKWMIMQKVRGAHQAAKLEFTKKYPEAMKQMQKGLQEDLKNMQNDIAEGTEDTMLQFLQMQQ